MVKEIGFNEIDKSMRKYAQDQIEREALMLIDICDDDKHEWEYNSKFDEIVCKTCGSFNGDYKGIGIMLMKIWEKLK